MFEQKTVGVVIPCYNEERQIAGVLSTIPDFVDRVMVVDDCSTDRTCAVLDDLIRAQGQSSRIVLLRHEKNSGPGAAVVTGYKEALRRGMDVVVKMDGDGQMDPNEMRLLVGPVARGEADYAKGNRLFHRDAWTNVPRIRYLGNAFLSMLTKIASGYWHVADSQTGYTAISLEALQTIDLDGVYRRYGYPNDMLVRLNVCDMRVADVPIRPVYNVGERSKMRVWKVIPTMSYLIFKRFCWRMWHKYVVHDFHPLVLFYLTGGVLGFAAVALFVRMAVMWIVAGRIPPINALMWAFCAVSAMQFILFAMWFDMEMNRDLKVRVPHDKGGTPGAPPRSAGS